MKMRRRQQCIAQAWIMSIGREGETAESQQMAPHPTHQQKVMNQCYEHPRRKPVPDMQAG